MKYLKNTLIALSVIVNIITVPASIIGIVLAIRADRRADQAEKREQIRLDEDRAREEALHNEARTPKVVYVGGRYGKNGDLILTLKNTSSGADAAIREMYFFVDDPASLDRIANVVPRKLAGIGSANLSVDAYFLDDGQWFDNRQTGQMEFFFQTQLGYNLEKGGKPEDYHFAIVNPKWNGGAFKGRLEITHDGGTLRIPNATLNGRSKK